MKKIKMLLYGEPGVGKSVFASKAPRPFFITTDGNYEWLEDFGAKEEDHRQVFSWSEAKDAFAQSYDNYDTIVVDLLEDMFKWCEYEFCTRSKIEHVSDIGYGKGYDISRNEFFLEISKLLGKDKHIILITHGVTFVTKDRRGVEHTKYAPSNRIPDKVLDMIEGRIRYCLRCYLKAEEQGDGVILKKRYLSLVPKENEFGIARGLDENKVPHDIDLEFEQFAKWIGLDTSIHHSTQARQSIKDEDKSKIEKMAKEHFEDIGQKAIEQLNKLEERKTEIVTQEPVQEVAQEQETVQEVVQEKIEEPVQEQKREEVKPSQQDRLAAIKAKLAAMKAQNQK